MNIRGIDGNFDGSTSGGGGAPELAGQPDLFQLSRPRRGIRYRPDRRHRPDRSDQDRPARSRGGGPRRFGGADPRSALSIKKPFLEATIGGGYEPLRGKPLFRDELVLGARFGIGSKGLITEDDGTARAGFFSNATPSSFVLTQFQLNNQRGIDDAGGSHFRARRCGPPTGPSPTSEAV